MIQRSADMIDRKDDLKITLIWKFAILLLCIALANLTRLTFSSSKGGNSLHSIFSVKIDV